MHTVISTKQHKSPVSHTYANQAARYSLACLTRGRCTSDASIMNTAHRLVDRRRARFCELGEAGWSYTVAKDDRPTDAAITAALSEAAIDDIPQLDEFGKPLSTKGTVRLDWFRVNNCPHVGFYHADRPSRGNAHYACLQSWVCPWCWCRNTVFPIHSRVTELLFPAGGDPKLPRLPKYDMYVIHSKAVLRRSDTPLKDVFEGLTTAKNYFAGVYKRGPGAAAVICSTVEPAAHASDDRLNQSCWLAHQRILWLLPVGASVAGKPFADRFGLFGRSCKVTSFLAEDITKRRLVAAVGDWARYPKYLLDGPAKPTVAILEMRKNYPGRFLESYGLLRNPVRAS